MSPKTVNIHAAKTHFSRLIARVQRGQEVIIAKAGKPVARLCPIEPPKRAPAPAGFAKDSILYIADDFDAPMPEFEDAFYNGPIFPESPEHS